jgi:hypothetical protein
MEAKNGSPGAFTTDAVSSGDRWFALAFTRERAFHHGCPRISSTLARGVIVTSNTNGRRMEAGLLFRHGVPLRATYLFKHALVQDACHVQLLASASSLGQRAPCESTVCQFRPRGSDCNPPRSLSSVDCVASIGVLHGGRHFCAPQPANSCDPASDESKKLG